MVLSNLSSNVDVESRAMATMGDTLGRSGLGTEVGEPDTLGRESHCRVWRATGFCHLCGPSSGRYVLRFLGELRGPEPWLPVCLFSFQRSLRCRTLLLPHGPGRIGGLHKENNKTCLNWIEPQVRTVEVSVFL